MSEGKQLRLLLAPRPLTDRLGSEFFVRGSSRVKRLRERLDMTTSWVEPEVMVDFLATDRLEQ